MINRKCKTCGKLFDTPHDYAKECGSCYFAGKEAKEKESEQPTQSTLLPEGDSIASALNNIADSIRVLAKAVEQP